MRNRHQQDTLTADSDTEFDDAEEPVEDTEISRGREARHENNPVSTTALTLLDTKSADTETPACTADH